MSNWIVSSKMRLNVSKSNVMWFTPESFQPVCFPPVLIGDMPLQQVTVQKYLGILIDENLSFLEMQLRFLMLVKLCLIIYFGLIQSANFYLWL